MFFSPNRIKLASPIVIATLTALAGVAACVSYLLLHSPQAIFRADSFLVTGVAFEKIVEGVWLALIGAVALLLYYARREVYAKWLIGAFFAVMAIGIVNRQLSLGELSIHAAWILGLLEGVGCAAAVLLALGLPLLVSRLAATARTMSEVKEIDRRLAAESIDHAAHHDPLTGLPTRTLLRDRLGVLIEHAKRAQDTLAVVMIDLDNFKRINDSLGHHAGDTVLCEISLRLKDIVRKPDTVARMSGDEFIVLLSDVRSTSYVEEICAKLLNAVAQPIHVERHEIVVTASIGISLFPDCDDVDGLFRNADLAMHRVKAHGRNASQVFTPAFGVQGLQQLQMESALRNALNARELEILYQPQICFSNREMRGVEALIRWHSPIFGTVLPNTFIPIAEETGMIVAIGEWVLMEACKQAAALQERLGIQFSLAVNISPRQFQQKNFPATVEHALQFSNLKPEQLELEITEQLFMVDSYESLEIMQRVRKLGVRFAIDDFGTGFSNMGYITRFAVDRIKIDRSFISRCDVDGTSRAVTAAIIALAHNLDIDVIAEGVESEHHIRMLTQMSCDQGQGFFYSPPLQASELEAFAARSSQKAPFPAALAMPPSTGNSASALTSFPRAE